MVRARGSNERVTAEVNMVYHFQSPYKQNDACLEVIALSPAIVPRTLKAGRVLQQKSMA